MDNVTYAIDELFGDICGGYAFWNSSAVLQPQPEISPCFTETALVWVPYGYLWLALGPYFMYVSRRVKDPPLPWSKLQLTKTLLTGLLLCLVIAHVSVTAKTGYSCSADTSAMPAAYLADGIKAATFLLVLLVEQFMRRKGIKSSGVPFVFWLLIAVTDIVSLYNVVTVRKWCATSSITCIQFGVIWVQLFLRCFADQQLSRGYQSLQSETPCPDENSSVLSNVTYSWHNGMVVKAYKTTLTTRDLWQQTRKLKCSTVVPTFLKHWHKAQADFKKQQQKHTALAFQQSIDETAPILGNGWHESYGNLLPVSDSTQHGPKGPSLFRVVVKSFGWLWVEACLYKIIGDSFFLLQPVLLQQIIGVIEQRDDPTVETNPMWVGLAFSVLLFVNTMLKTVFWHAAWNHVLIIGLRLKSALIGALYRKAMTMSNSAKKSTTVGEIVNLMSVDCQRLQDSFAFSHFVVSLPYLIIVGMVQLWMLMGVAVFGGIAVVAMAMAINSYFGRVQQFIQKEILALKSQRIKIMNEIISGIKVLKMYTWEIPFEKKVTAIRKQELRLLWKFAVITAVAIALSYTSPWMTNFVLVAIYTLTSSVHYLDAQTAFVAVSLMNIFRQPISVTPFLINGVIQGMVSGARIESFLWKEDMDDDVDTTDEGVHMINIENGAFTWNRSNPSPTLKNINLRVKPGRLYAVVGQVGSGKSSLISAILGEMEKLQGNVTRKGTVAYVPQEAWIQNMTLRDNILFGCTMNEHRYNKVLSGCALLPDLDILPGGDMTEIGEKGINISGGQKQRVSLARAVYSDADVLLMDDPLSAVDSHVGKHLFKNVIGPQGLLKRKTRILVTHGIHWLPMVDRILVMTNGRISETGTYEQLVSRDGPFAQFLQSYLENNDEDDASDNADTEAREMRDNVLSDAESTASWITSDEEGIVHRRRRRNDSHRESFEMTFRADSTADVKLTHDTMNRLITEEQSQKGAVKLAVFHKYFQAIGYIALIFVFIFLITFQSMDVFNNYWLTYWTEDELLKNVSQGHTRQYENRFTFYIVGYSIIGVIEVCAILAFGVLALTRLVRASGILHHQMLDSILRSPMSFFDTTPVGRIMNRFSSDIEVVDNRMPFTFRLLAIQLVIAVSTVIVVSVNLPPFVIVIVPVAIGYLLLLKFYLPTARQVKRLESVLRSPIYNHFSETISGVSVIRAYRCADRFISEAEQRVDKNSAFFYAANTGSRWIGVRLEFLSAILILAASVFAVLAEGLNGAQVGMSITYALQITSSMNLVIQSVSEMEMNIVSAERVKEYTELPSEAPWTVNNRSPDPDWPRSGDIEFRLFRTRYREGLDLVLKGIDCRVNSGEKVGIVGRTGAGKSSLTLSLFRLIEAAGGAIYIDGQDIGQIGLHDVRSKLTILPQDPVLFSGTLRDNLDPFDRFTDSDIWTAVDRAHLKTAVQKMSGQLEYECGEGGSNLSMGQRQLVCLARTLLHKTRILILDEATAAVDLETDDLIQNTIRTEFSDCTVLTIAHRLNTIMDYDRVMVLADGSILELDKPTNLLEDKESAFYKMAKDAGLVT